jgi:phage recombination protein Bet
MTNDLVVEAPKHLEQPAEPKPDDLAAKSLARAQETSRALARELFSAERIELIKRQVCPAGITDAEFAVFLEQCRRSGLDPLMKEAYCVPRKVRVADADGHEREVTVHTFQAAEQGMQIRAHRSGVFLGMRCGAVYEGDTGGVGAEIDFVSGKVTHVAKIAKRGALLGAWAIAFRSDLAVSPVAFVRLQEYSGLGPLWKNKPETMIVKVARAAALRLSFPYEFAGAYTPEELDAGETSIPEAMRTVIAEAIVDSPAKGSSKGERIRAQLAAKASTPASASAPAATPPKPAAPAEIPMSSMRFGSARGKPLLECTGAELDEGAAAAEQAIAANPDASWVPSARARVELIRAEQKRRAQALEAALDDHPKHGAPARQPGEEG